MKKWICACAAAMLAVTVLAGCGGKSGSQDAAAQTSQTAAKSQTEAESQTTEKSQTEAESQKADTKEQAAEDGQSDKKAANGQSADEQAENSGISPEELKAAAGKHHVKITVKDYGTISVELDGDNAPITVANFLKLAKDGFYDGLTFHRIISGFMIQGGDPLGTGMGGSDVEIKGEFAKNGVENPLSHTRGAISMARSQFMDSASSQFFIVHEDSTFLDGEYACFGYVTEGMEAVDAICEAVKAEDKNGTVAKDNQPVIESIEVID